MRKILAILLSLCLLTTAFIPCCAAEDSSKSITRFQLGEFSFEVPDGMEAVSVGEYDHLQAYIVTIVEDTVIGRLQASDISGWSESGIERWLEHQQKLWDNPDTEHYAESQRVVSLPGFDVTFRIYTAHDNSEKLLYRMVGIFTDSQYAYVYWLDSKESDPIYIDLFTKFITESTRTGEDRGFVPEEIATAGQLSALRSAGSYLSFGAFSYNGLIKQLEYEGFTQEEAQYAADNCGADWCEQAEKSAKNYLGFSAFSYKGLIKQLEYEGFSTEEATYGADRCGADWMEQAAKSAENYLSIMGFSRSGLITQLEYEGFTHEQAVYGVEQNGL